MSLPIVAIVGRPNVGKSSLLNLVAKDRVSIVDPTPGVTRDRISVICNEQDCFFELVDTGGYGIEDHDNLTEDVEAQIRLAIGMASLVLFVVDTQAGLVPLDRTVADLLRKNNVTPLLVANKVDTDKWQPQSAEFLKLGFGDPVCLSAQHGWGRQDLMDVLVQKLGPLAGQAPPEPVMKIAVVGKRNVGKSTFINALAGEGRVIASDVPGTTRDAVDVTFDLGGRTFVAIDTAGVRKKTKLDNIEFYGFNRATKAILRADVVLFLIDGTAPVSHVDKTLARFIADAFKPCILVINKWDLAKDRATTDDFGEYLTKVLPEMSYAPIAMTTATDIRNIQSTIDLAGTLFNQAQTRVTTARLNQALEEATSERTPSAKKGTKRPKLYYATQISVAPPTIVVFVNDPSAVREDYQRFLLNRFRDTLPFSEIPIRMIFRSHRGKSRTPDVESTSTAGQEESQ